MIERKPSIPTIDQRALEAELAQATDEVNRMLAVHEQWEKSG